MTSTLAALFLNHTILSTSPCPRRVTEFSIFALVMKLLILRRRHRIQYSVPLMRSCTPHLSLLFHSSSVKDMKIAKSAVRKHAKGRFSHFPRGLNRRFSLLIPRQNYSHTPPFVLQRSTSMTLHIASQPTPSPLQDCNDVLIRNKITLNDHMISIHILPLLSTTTNCLDLALRLVEWRGFCAEWLCQGPVFCILPCRMNKFGKLA